MRSPCTYSPTTYLFQTNTSSSLPMPIVAVDPSTNNQPWNLTQPDTGSNLPATFLVRGDVWRYTGLDANGNALYQGYYYDSYNNPQFMTVDAPDANGQQLVIVSDPINGSTSGVLNSARGSARLRDGEVVYSGNYNGSLLDLANNTTPKLQTIAADLDITGNVISFGALQGDAEAAGVTLQFTDDGSIGTLTSALGRPLAQWVWSRSDPSSLEAPALPVMKLDKDNGLTLYDQALVSGSPPGVTLNPKSNGVSSIAGVLRVRPGGDIPMGNFTAVPPNQTAP
jgi:hypothetical protein